MFNRLFRVNGTVDELVTKIKNNTLNTFADMPSNVHHWRGEEEGEKREFDPEVFSRYSGASKAHRMAYNLLRHTAVKMPQLRFCVKLGYEEVFDGMYVFDKLECVGHVGYEDSGALNFSNARISEDLHRRSIMKTASQSKAATILRKYFYGMTKVETMQSMAGLMKAAVSSAHSDTIYKRRGAKQRVTEELERAVFSDSQLSQAVLQYFEATNQSHLMAKYEDAKDDFELVEEAYNAQRLGKGLFVQAVGEEYQMWRKDSTRVQTCNRNRLPDKVRGALGMLKLADNNSFVNRVGFKMEAEKFWIAEELANELNS
jgi:uncharacterized protein YdeI (YjbR/CyaY-like superfamily)